MIKILHNLALFRVKNANFFAEIFGENILKILTSVPDPICVSWGSAQHWANTQISVHINGPLTLRNRSR
jgi:hypothetical protein